MRPYRRNLPIEAERLRNKERSDDPRRTLLTAIGLLIATSAHAKPSVSTPPIPNNVNLSSVALCQAVNTGTKAAMVSIEIVEMSSQTIVAAAGPFNILPDAQIQVLLSNPRLYDEFCGVTGVSKSKVTILLAEFDLNANPLISVTAP